MKSIFYVRCIIGEYDLEGGERGKKYQNEQNKPAPSLF